MGRGAQMSFGLYIGGFAILIVGLAIGAHLAHMPARWIGVGVIVMVGIGILKGVTKTRRPDPS
jgi:cadmium resistance protein CadD (predicted permease)